MSIRFRDAKERDLPAIVALLKDDLLGQGRETDDLNRYRDMWIEIQASPDNALIVGEIDGTVVACYQLTTIPGFTLNATRRAEIEGVRVAGHLRGQGIGAQLIADAVARAKAKGAGLMQLTMNAKRDEAHAFYIRNGFEPTHVGFKMKL